MPAYEYSHKHKAFIKECSCCKTITIGTEDHDTSLVIFLGIFSSAGPSSGMADGMQSRCWTCNSSKRRQLGITGSILDEMFAKQGGKCAICTNEISITRNADTSIHAHVDHDEDTGIVRDLLCGNCNRGIGLFKHEPDRLVRAAEYIARHRGTIVPLRRRG